MRHAGLEVAHESSALVIDAAHGVGVGLTGINFFIKIGRPRDVRHSGPAVSAVIIDPVFVRAGYFVPGDLYAVRSAGDIGDAGSGIVFYLLAGQVAARELLSVGADTAHGVGIVITRRHICIGDGGFLGVGQLCPALAAVVIHAVFLRSRDSVPFDIHALCAV